MSNRDHSGSSITMDYADPRAGSHNESADSGTSRPARRLASARPRRASREDTHESLAYALGWFSVGLGMAEILAPRAIARVVGLQDDHRISDPCLGIAGTDQRRRPSPTAGPPAGSGPESPATPWISLAWERPWPPRKPSALEQPLP